MMASRLSAPASGAFVPLHLHRSRRSKKHWSDTAILMMIAGGLVFGMACVRLWVARDRLREILSPPGGSGVVASKAPSRPGKKRPKPPARPLSRAALPGGSGAREKSPWVDEADGFNGIVPWAKTEAATPFESETPVDARNTIDELVFARLAALNIKPAKLCSDEVFLRRVYIDVLGTLPTVEEAKRFLDDPDPDKRAKLIDHALQRPEFADYWAMKWCDVLRVKAEFPIKLWPNAAQAYHRWIRTAINNNLHYDDFARELLTGSGSNFRAPQVNFYRAVQSKEPKAIAQAVALTFLCERADQWPKERLEGMSAFFSQVGYKPTGEWKEEIVFFDRRKRQEPEKPKEPGEVKELEKAKGSPGKAESKVKKEAANEPLTAIYPNGVAVQIPPGQDPRRVFADWLMDDKNPWFARAMANRAWCWLVGRGIVDPPDDIRRDNPASNLPLLNHLAAELIASDYDLRHLYRLILNSQTYQLACIPGSEDSKGAENFASYPLRRLDAEVLIDAICQITATTESYSSIIPEPYTFLPEGTRAIALPDGSITSSFLEMFGRPARDTGLESERNNRLSAAQALHLLNSNHVRNKLKQGDGIKDLVRGVRNSDAVAELLYLAILSRRPTESELDAVSGWCGSPEGARDVAWALINSDEFLFRH
jgi:hypothetical protein